MERTPRFSSLFFRQRLNAAVLPMLGGIFLFLFLPRVLAFLSLILCAVGCFVVIFRSEGEKRSTFLCFLAGIALSLFLMGLRGIVYQNMLRLCGTPLQAEGYVVEEGAEYYDLSLSRLDGKAFRKRVRVSGASDWKTGEKRRLTLMLYSPDPKEGRAEGVDALAKACGNGTVSGKSYLYTLVGGVRRHLLADFASRENGGFLSAVLLGERSGLTQTQVDAFRQTASSHILAISGLHISQTVAFLVILLGVFPISRKTTRYLLYPFVFLLYLLAGAGVSVFRASVMTLFSVTGLLLRVRSDSVTALCFSAALLVMANPYAVESPSFLLSYASTFGVVYCGVPISEYLRRRFTEKGMNPILKKLRTLVLSLAVSVVSSVFTLPVQLLLFGTASPFAPLYAVLLIPLFQISLIFALLGAFLTGVHFLPATISNFFLGLSASFPDLVEFLAKGAPSPVFCGELRGVFAFLFIAALVVAFWKKAPMSVLFLLQAVSVLLFGVFSLIASILV